MAGASGLGTRSGRCLLQGCLWKCSYRGGNAAHREMTVKFPMGNLPSLAGSTTATTAATTLSLLQSAAWGTVTDSQTRNRIRGVAGEHRAPGEVGGGGRSWSLCTEAAPRALPHKRASADVNSCPADQS